jgi:hypothetical protein
MRIQDKSRFYPRLVQFHIKTKCARMELKKLLSYNQYYFLPNAKEVYYVMAIGSLWC